MKTLLKCIFSAVYLIALSCSGKSIAPAENNIEYTDDVVGWVPKHDFSVVVAGDTVYFNILDDKQSVSLAYWGRSNFDNHTIVVPSYVDHQGNRYKVVEIGDEAMGVNFYGEHEMDRIWGTDENKVERIILPPSVKRVGNAAFTARFRNSDYVVELTDSIECLGSYAVNCMSIRDENNAIILPANIRVVECLLDDEDHEVEGEPCDVIFSKLYIPEHLESIDGLDYFGRNQPIFETVEVHPRNKHFKSINGTLYSYDLDSIYWSTVHEKLYIPKKLRVDKNSIAFLEDGWYTHIQMPQFKSIITEKGNPYCVAIDNILYDIKNKCLIMIGGEDGSTINVPAWCNSVDIIYGYGYNVPKTFVFSNEASQTSVDSFISDLLEFIDNKDFTFVYKDQTWSNNKVEE